MGMYDSQVKQVDLHGLLSRYNGIFFSLFCFAQVVGNAISSVVLFQSQTSQSDLNQTAVCGADDCPSNHKRTTVIIRPEERVIEILLGIYLGCGLLGFLVTAIFLRPLNLEKRSRRDVLLKLLGCCKVFSDKKLVIMIPFSLSQALNTSILLTAFTKAYVSCTVGVKMVGYVMMTYGIVSAASAVIFGYVAKYSGRLPLMLLTFSVDIVTLVLLLLWKPVPSQVVLLFVIPCIWAVGDGICMSQVTSLVAIAFPASQPAVFSNLNVWSSIGFTFILATDHLFCLRTKLYIAVTLWALGVVGYLFLERILAKEKASSMEYQKVHEEGSDEVMEFDCEIRSANVDDDDDDDEK